jgi:hypothetical protein
MLVDAENTLHVAESGLHPLTEQVLAGPAKGLRYDFVRQVERETPDVSRRTDRTGCIDVRGRSEKRPQLQAARQPDPGKSCPDTQTDNDLFEQSGCLLRHVRESSVSSPDQSLPATLAPIALFAFDRPDLLTRTLKSLEQCHGFAESPLYMFCDAARTSDPAQVRRVEAVREILRRTANSRSATIIEAASKKGLRSSIVEGVSQVLESHDRVIVLEDDLILSPHFLTFMNRALEVCSARNDIVQVSGYFVPHAAKLPDVGLLRTPASWGWGTWKRAWTLYRDDAEQLLKEIERSDPAAFDLDGACANVDSLRRNATGELDNWGVRWYASVFLRNGLTLYPAASYVRNVGFAKGGTNTGPGRTARRYLTQELTRKPIRLNADQIESSESGPFLAALKDHHRWKVREWTRPTLTDRLKARWKLIRKHD